MIDTIFNIWIASILIVSLIGFHGAVIAVFYIGYKFITNLKITE